MREASLHHTLLAALRKPQENGSNDDREIGRWHVRIRGRAGMRRLVTRRLGTGAAKQRVGWERGTASLAATCCFGGVQPKGTAKAYQLGNCHPVLPLSVLLIMSCTPLIRPLRHVRDFIQCVKPQSGRRPQTRCG